MRGQEEDGWDETLKENVWLWQWELKCVVTLGWAIIIFFRSTRETQIIARGQTFVIVAHMLSLRLNIENMLPFKTATCSLQSKHNIVGLCHRPLVVYRMTY